MKLSIIVALPYADSPAAMLEAMTAQTVDATDVDVVVVDAYARPRADSTVRDAVARVASRLSVRLFEQHGSGRAAAVNRGVREAAAALLLLLASDFVPTSALVATHLELHEARPESSVCGLGPAIFTPGSTVTPFMRWLKDSGQLFGVSFTRPDAAALPGFWYGRTSRSGASSSSARAASMRRFRTTPSTTTSSGGGCSPQAWRSSICPARWRTTTTASRSTSG